MSFIEQLVALHLFLQMFYFKVLVINMADLALQIDRKTQALVE